MTVTYMDIIVREMLILMVCLYDKIIIKHKGIAVPKIKYEWTSSAKQNKQKHKSQKSCNKVYSKNILIKMLKGIGMVVPKGVKTILW